MLQQITRFPSTGPDSQIQSIKTLLNEWTLEKPTRTSDVTQTTAASMCVSGGRGNSSLIGFWLNTEG